MPDPNLRAARMAAVDAALEAAYPSTPLMVLSRTINRLAEVLPKGHECEAVFAQFDAVGEYVHAIEATVERQRDALDALFAKNRDYFAESALVWINHVCGAPSTPSEPQQ